MKLYRYKCGCIGTKRDKTGRFLVFYDGDHGVHDCFGLFFQQVDHDPVEEMSQPETERIIKSIGKLISDGYGLRQIRSLLGIENGEQGSEG